MSSPRTAAVSSMQENANGELYAEQPIKVNIEPADKTVVQLNDQLSAQSKETKSVAQIEETKDEPVIAQPTEKYPANKLLQSILATYQSSGFGVSNSNVVKALKSINQDCPNFEDQEKLYREGILLNVLYHADVPQSDLADHEEFRRNAISPGAKFTTIELEDKFLHYHSKNYFTPGTRAALDILKKEIDKNKAAAERDEEESLKTHAVEMGRNKEKDEDDEKEDFNVRGRKRSPSAESRTSAAMTVASSNVNASEKFTDYVTGSTLKGLSHKQEGKMFGKLYPIIAALRKAQKEGCPPLDERQWGLYIKMLHLFLNASSLSAEESIEKYATLYDEIMRDFGFDAKTRKLIATFESNLLKLRNGADPSKEKLVFYDDVTQDILMREAILSCMIREAGTERSRLLKDERLVRFKEEIIDKKEYERFHENAAILEVLRKAEAEKRLAPLSELQFKLYKKILDSFIFRYSAEQSSALYQEILGRFGFDSQMRAEIESRAAELAGKWPDVLKEELVYNDDLIEDIGIRKKIIACAVAWQGTVSSRLINDKRLKIFNEEEFRSDEPCLADKKDVHASHATARNALFSNNQKHSTNVTNSTLLRTLGKKPEDKQARCVIS